VDLSTATAKLIRFATRLTDNIGEITSSPELEARIDRLAGKSLGAYGVDAFGFDPEYLKRVIGFVGWVYRHWFRVEPHDLNNIPEGRCILIGNHSGQLPFDAAMVSASALIDREPPRIVRSMIERFVPNTPFVSVFMARCGQILGTPENCKRLLGQEEALIVFPEGVRGLNKTYDQRYRLQEFGQGFMRLAIETATPVVPVAVIGAEEQAPSFFNAKAVGSLFGFPAFPVTPTNPLLPLVGLLPYPVKYRLYFGPAMRFDGDANDEDEVIRRKVEEVRMTLQKMIDLGLDARQHVFW
jgi:1-acyl-sn-glycerol-3-phosphate acyltransferase